MVLNIGCTDGRTDTCIHGCQVLPGARLRIDEQKLITWRFCTEFTTLKQHLQVVQQMQRRRGALAETKRHNVRIRPGQSCTECSPSLKL